MIAIIFALLLGCRSAQLQLNHFENTALAGSPHTTVPVPRVNATWAGDMLWSAEFIGTITTPTQMDLAMVCSFKNVVAIAWIDDHIMCLKGIYVYADTVFFPPTFSFQPNKSYVFKVHVYHNATSMEDPPSAQVGWARPGAAVGEPDPITADMMSPTLPKLEVQARTAQKALLKGWTTWAPHNYLALVRQASAPSVIPIRSATAACNAILFTHTDTHDNPSAAHIIRHTHISRTISNWC